MTSLLDLPLAEPVAGVDAGLDALDGVDLECLEPGGLERLLGSVHRAEARLAGFKLRVLAR
ncbi:MAG: hypothetical protein ACJ716_10725, partial [Marmoricola sp.]